MAFLRRYWYDIGALAAIVVTIVLALLWGVTSTAQKLLLANFIAILLHQFEEYGWPGGEPAIMNRALQPSDRPDRYPLNQNSAMVVNVLAAYGFYLIPVFAPGVFWLGVAPALFGLGQFGIHGIVTPKKLGQFYNPGIAAVILLHIPIGLAYFWTIRHEATAIDWIAGVVYTFAFMSVALLKMTYSWLADRDSPYPFPPEEMTRFDVPGKLARLREQRR